MDTQPLFLDSPIRFDGEEKYAGMLTRLSDNTDQWPQEIMQEAYKQLPYLSDFEANVLLDKVDEERGYAFGSIEVRHKTAMTPQELEVSPLTKVHIPLIVREQQLAPLDVFMKGKKYQPLTEGRMRSSMLRPDMFDAARIRPADPHIIHDMRPPLLDGFGGTTKVGSKLAMMVPILPQLNGRVLERHQERLLKLAQDPSVRAAFENAHEGVQAALLSALQLEPSDHLKTAQVISDTLRPNVVQLRKLANGNVMVKWANSDLYAPRQEELPMSTAQDLLGDVDMVPEMEDGQVVTLSPDAPVKETLDAEEIGLAEQFGLWQVQDLQGNEMIGWVFPQLLSFDMQPLPLSLFTNGAVYALQDQIAGKIAGKSTDIPKGVPRGYGAFYYIDHGTAKAFVPLTVTTTSRGPDGGTTYFGNLDTGETLRFSFAHGLRNVVKVGEDEYVLPDSLNWMPLRGKTELVSEPTMFAKTAHAKGFVAMAEIVGDGGVFSFRGPAIAKVAEAQTKFLDRPSAEFLAVALGMDPTFAKTALDHAAKSCTVTVPNLRILCSPAEKLAEARTKVMKELSELDPPIHNYFLAKEASILDDALTADRILGLGFINAENLSTFVDMLPGLEETASNVAELLVAVRLGIKDIPEVAVERMLAALNDVITGLRSLQHKELNFAA